MMVLTALICSGTVQAQHDRCTPLTGKASGSAGRTAPVVDISPSAASPSAPGLSATYVGSWHVGDGPVWNSNPPVLSARETAALLWGGLPTDYAISTISSNPADINRMAFVDGYGDQQYLTTPVSEDYKLTSAPPGYDSPPSYSAWVLDHSCFNRYTDPGLSCDPSEPGLNYAFRIDASTTIGCADWAGEVGTWGPGTPPCGDLTSTANTVTYESASLATVYDDFTYEVEMVCTRPVQPTAANTLFVRGTPQPYQTTAQWWNSGIAFNISMSGKYSIFRYQGRKMIALQSWTTPAGNIINPTGSPNTLKVEATGGTLTFSINGTPVKTITGQTLLSGQVGLGMVRSIPTTQAGPNDTLVVNSATVTPGAPPQPARVSLQQEKANQDANRALPSPDPHFAPMSSRGIAGSR